VFFLGGGEGEFCGGWGGSGGGGGGVVGFGVWEVVVCGYVPSRWPVAPPFFHPASTRAPPLIVRPRSAAVSDPINPPLSQSPHL